MGEKPKLAAVAVLREGGLPRSDSPLGLPFGRGAVNGLSV